MESPNAEWRSWPVSWGAVWVGALSALAVGLLIGLLGYAAGAHEVSQFVDWKKVRLTGLIFSIAGAFFAFVVGGWTAARIVGIRRSEPAMLHGAIVWLVGVALLLFLSGAGATPNWGGWYGGLAGGAMSSNPTMAADPNFAVGVRNTTFATLVALLLGLIGSVLGGWMASGEPMTLTYYRRRDLDRPEAARGRRTT